jgi:hypothetical protein
MNMSFKTLLISALLAAVLLLPVQAMDQPDYVMDDEYFSEPGTLIPQKFIAADREMLKGFLKDPALPPAVHYRIVSGLLQSKCPEDIDIGNAALEKITYDTSDPSFHDALALQTFVQDPTVPSQYRYHITSVWLRSQHAEGPNIAGPVLQTMAFNPEDPNYQGALVHLRDFGRTTDRKALRTLARNPLQNPHYECFLARCLFNSESSQNNKALGHTMLWKIVQTPKHRQFSGAVCGLVESGSEDDRNRLQQNAKALGSQSCYAIARSFGGSSLLNGKEIQRALLMHIVETAKPTETYYQQAKFDLENYF